MPVLPRTAFQVMADRGLDLDRPKLVREITRRISYTLKRHREKGLVESERGHGTWLVWWLKASE